VEEEIEIAKPEDHGNRLNEKIKPCHYRDHPGADSAVCETEHHIQSHHQHCAVADAQKQPALIGPLLFFLPEDN